MTTVSLNSMMTYIRCPICGRQANLMLYSMAYCCQEGHVTVIEEVYHKNDETKNSDDKMA
jgi:hypothetical protein